MFDIIILIPALNERNNLPLVLGAIPKDPRVNAVVIDNGSDDGTPEVARALGATVVHEPRRGYGSACQRGLVEIAQAHPRPRVTCILDADFADDPRQLPRLWQPVLDGQADLVVSTRTQGGAEPGSLTTIQRVGNRVQVAALNRRFGLRLTDMGPMRAFSTEVALSLGLRDPTWGWNVEMAAKFARAGKRIVEVPVPYRNRHAGASKISGSVRGAARASTRILLSLLRYGTI